MRPIPWYSGATIYGHYSTFQKSGATVSIGAGGHIGRIRWAPSSGTGYLVLMKLRVGYSVISAITAAVPMDFDAIIARSYSVDHSTAITNANMTATVSNTNQMRSVSMKPSQMGASGPGICTTAVISGQTLTLDNTPFCGATFVNQPSGNATVTQAIGVAGPMTTMYEWTPLGAHPPVLQNGEGIVVRQVTAGTVTGTMALYLEWHWAEVVAF